MQAASAVQNSDRLASRVFGHGPSILIAYNDVNARLSFEANVKQSTRQELAVLNADSGEFNPINQE